MIVAWMATWTGKTGHLRRQSHVEPLPRSFPERQGKEHSKETCTVRMPRTRQRYIKEAHDKRSIARDWREREEQSAKG